MNRLYFKCAIGYCIFLTYSCLMPFSFHFSKTHILMQIEQIRWSPYMVNGHRESIPDIVSNLALFMPFGFFIAGAVGARINIFFRLIAVICIGALTSLFQELLQLLVPTRISSVTDLINNSLSSLIGAITFIIYYKLFKDRVKVFLYNELHKPLSHNYAMLILCFTALFMLVPFDISIDVGDLKRSVTSFVRSFHVLPSADMLRASIQNVILFSLAAFTLYLGVRFKKRLVFYSIMILLFLFGFACILEFAKLFIVSQHARITNIFCAQLGAVSGLVLAWHVARRGHPMRMLRNLFIVGYIVFLVLEYWYPYRLSLQAARSVWIGSFIPFYMYFLRIDVVSLKDLIFQVILFMPVGFLPIHIKNRHLKLFFVGLGVGLILEMCQIVIESRFVDVTDAISSGAGCMIGSICAQKFFLLRRKALNGYNM